jgi:alkyldihydroxyacetonephosphate synthase
MGRYRGFKPEWEHEPPPPGSFRSIFKWGAREEFKEPNERLYRLMKEHFGLTDEDFTRKQNEGLEQVPDSVPSGLAEEHVQALAAIVGRENLKRDTYSRLEVAYGKTMWDLYRLREGIMENLPEAVLHPGSREEIEEIVAYCHRHEIPLYVYGGGSSVTRGVEPYRGGISLDLRPRFAKVIAFNETDQTITVESGISGPELEAALQEAPERFGARRRYTCGHFPQSFEYSCVGGWVVTRGAGQNSTYYGNIKDIVMGQEYATPQGRVKSYGLPAHAVGPDIDEIMMGSEGAFGVLTHVTLKVFRRTEGSRRRFSYIFPDWQRAREAAREMMQSQAGYPSVFRLSDPEETDVALKLYSVEGTPLDWLMKLWGYRKGERCLLLGWTEGQRGYARNLRRVIGRVARRHGGLTLTGYPAVRWERSRFRDPYMREALQDFGIVIDTMECGVRWENMEEVHAGVRAFAKSRPGTICMTHLSHAYPQGANLYFIFIGKFADKEEYREFQYGIFDNIQRYGASMSHHHGVGKMTARWIEDSIGSGQLAIFRALKRHFDPRNVMNPGGTVALDLPDEQKRRPRFAGRRWDDPAY